MSNHAFCQCLESNPFAFCLRALPSIKTKIVPPTKIRCLSFCVIVPLCLALEKNTDCKAGPITAVGISSTCM